MKAGACGHQETYVLHGSLVAGLADDLRSGPTVAVFAVEVDVRFDVADVVFTVSDSHCTG